MPTVPSTGWGVLHLFFHVRPAALPDPGQALTGFAGQLTALDDQPDYQVLPFTVLGQKADLGLMVLGPDLDVLDRFTYELSNGPFGEALIPAGSYVSITELSEYTSTGDDERRRLIDEEGLGPDSPELTERLAAFEKRMAAYNEHRLHPKLPMAATICFYPMSKRRDGDDNWYRLPYSERKALMAGHAAVGRTYRGRVLQLITTSLGFDDWEWGVTLLSDDASAINEIVYEMRFDEISARYAEFGPFVFGLLRSPSEVADRLRPTP